METTTTQTIIIVIISTGLIGITIALVLWIKSKGYRNIEKSTYVCFFDSENCEIDLNPLLIEDVNGLQKVAKLYPLLQFQVFKNGIRLLEKPWRSKRLPEFIDIYNQVIKEGWQFTNNANSFCFWEREGKFMTTEQVFRVVE